MSQQKTEAPEEFPDEAWQEPGPDGLTQAQLAARISTRREQAMQDAGWVQPPGPDEETPEPEAEETPPTEEPEPKPEPAEEGAEEEEEPEAEAEEPEPEEEGEFYVARYKTREAAEQALSEKDETIQRLFRERDQQRQEVEQALQEQEAQPQQLNLAAWNEWAQGAIENGAGQDGALAALREGGMEGYNLYLRYWLDDDESRADALAFNNQVMLEFAEIRARAAVAPQVEERQQRTSQQEAEEAKRRVSANYEDFDSYSEAMDRLVQEPDALPQDTKEWLAEQAQSGLDGKVRAWEYLYLRASKEKAPTRARAATEERKRRRTSGDRAKVEATVSSAEGSASRTPPTEADQQILDRRNALRKEWGLPPVEED